MRFIHTEVEREQSFIDTITDPKVLTAHIVGSEPKVKRRKYDIMHVSMLDKICAREYVIGYLLNQERTEQIGFPMQTIFNMGSALHSWIQNHPEVYFGRNKFLGNWRCLGCNRQRRFGTKPITNCEFCDASYRATVYDEYLFRTPAVSGKIDGILNVGGKYRIPDIKTTAKDIEYPNGSDIIQLASYMYFSHPRFCGDELPVEIDRSVGYLIYFNKVFNFRAPVKTFKIEPTAKLMEPIIAKTVAFTKGKAQGILPNPLKKCVVKSFVIKTCPMADKCAEFHFEERTTLPVPV